MTLEPPREAADCGVLIALSWFIVNFGHPPPLVFSAEYRKFMDKMIRERAHQLYEKLGGLPSHELALLGTAGLRLVPRSCSLLNVDPHVLHRHSAFGFRAELATFTPCWGLQDKDSSSPQCKHKCLDKRPPSGPVRTPSARPWVFALTLGMSVSFTTITPASGTTDRRCKRIASTATTSITL